MTFEEYKAKVHEAILETIPPEHLLEYSIEDDLLHNYERGDDPVVVGRGLAEGLDDWLNYGQYE